MSDPGAATPLLSVRDLAIEFPGPGGAAVRVVDGVSFDVAPGEIVALVGESGSGKSLTGLALLDLVPEPGRIVDGTVVFEGREVRAMDDREKRRVRGGGIGLVFQEPGSALDPVRTVGSELVGVLRRHRGLSRADARRAALEWLARVSLPDPERRFDDLPHRMSGGMRQRAMIALALAGGPRLLVADEPTTALDVTIQAQILALLRNLRAELGLAVLLVTHDLGVVADTADRVLVMYAGAIVEEAPVRDLFASPAHPYTRALLALRAADGPRRPGARLPALGGAVPDAEGQAPGCAFAPRCPEVVAGCRDARPPLVTRERRRVACFVHEERFR